MSRYDVGVAMLESLESVALWGRDSSLVTRLIGAAALRTPGVKLKFEEYTEAMHSGSLLSSQLRWDLEELIKDGAAGNVVAQWDLYQGLDAEEKRVFESLLSVPNRPTTEELTDAFIAMREKQYEGARLVIHQRDQILKYLSDSADRAGLRIVVPTNGSVSSRKIRIEEKPT